MQIVLKSKMKKYFCTGLLYVLASIAIADTTKASSELQESLVFGVVPQQSAAKLAMQWGPLLNAWSEVTGIRFRFATARDIPTFEQRLAEGDYDLAYMNPYHFTLVNQTPGYTALAHAKDKRITGIVVAHKDWASNLADLNNKTLAFPAPRAFAASILTQSELRQRGITIIPKYVGSHDSVYMAVAKGLYPAGGGVIRTYNSLPDTIKDQLTVIYQTASYTPHAIAFSNTLDSNTVQKLRASITLLNEHAQAQAMFKLLSIKGLEAAHDDDWADVMNLDIKL
jgi:phosphonate transport system substrate-binding protein